MPDTADAFVADKISSRNAPRNVKLRNSIPRNTSTRGLNSTSVKGSSTHSDESNKIVHSVLPDDKWKNSHFANRPEVIALIEQGLKSRSTQYVTISELIKQIDEI